MPKIFDFNLPHYNPNWEKMNNIDFNPKKFPLTYLALARRLETLSGQLNVVEIITPSHENLISQRDKTIAAFHSGQIFNPKFDYPWIKNTPIKIEILKKDLKKIISAIKLEPANSEEEKIAKLALYNRAEDSFETLLLIEGLQTNNERKIKNALNKKYPDLDDYLFLLAQSQISQSESNHARVPHLEYSKKTLLNASEKELLKNKKCNSTEISTAFNWLLTRYGFDSTSNKSGYTVIMTDEATVIDVRDRSIQPMTIYIPQNKEITANQLLRLMYHEIEGHARQSMNGKDFIYGGGVLKIDDETLYEGLALRLEKKYYQDRLYGGNDNYKQDTPFYVIAVKLAQEGKSFFEIFKNLSFQMLGVKLGVYDLDEIDFENTNAQLLLNGILPQAWNVTYRIMRGHLDTQNKLSFAYRKDLAYLRGFIVDEALDNMNLGQVDEQLSVKTNALPRFAKFLIKVGDIKYPFLNATETYCLEILLPQLKKEKQLRALICLPRDRALSIQVKSRQAAIDYIVGPKIITCHQSPPQFYGKVRFLLTDNSQKRKETMHLTNKVIDDVYASRESHRPEDKFVMPLEENKPENIYNYLRDELLLDGNAKQNLATFCSTWMEPEVHKLMDDSIAKNLIDKDEYPQSAEIELRCEHILADLWHSPSAKTTLGTSTVGSSEAAMLGGLAMKWRWRKMREAQGKDTNKPNFVCGPVQICWYKFAKYFDVEIRSVPLEGDRLEMTAESMIPYIDENTIGVVPTLGVTYTCRYENVKEISDMLDRIQTEKGWDIPIHVDAASGGFIAPFLHKDLVWDFRLPRVKSINTSGHKFGLAPLGVGWVIWREKQDLPEDLIFYVNYLGGNEATFALNFSRPAGQIIAQYYNFLRLGVEGYTKIQDECAKVAKYFCEGISKMGIFDILYDGQGALPGGCWSLKNDVKVTFNLFDITDRLRGRGWLLPAYSMPKDRGDLVIQRILVRHGFSMDMADLLLADFKRVVEFLRDRGGCGSLSESDASSFKHT